MPAAIHRHLGRCLCVSIQLEILSPNMAMFGWRRDRKQQDQASEERSLLDGGGVGNELDKVTPLPWRQLAVVCLIRVRAGCALSIAAQLSIVTACRAYLIFCGGSDSGSRFARH